MGPIAWLGRNAARLVPAGLKNAVAGAIGGKSPAQLLVGAAVDHFNKPLLKEFSKSAAAFLEKHGNKLVTKLYACRTPLSRAVEMIVNGAGGKGWMAERARLGYNKLYHTFLRGQLEDGTKFNLEKNDQPEIAGKGDKRPEEENMEIAMPQAHTLRELTDDGIKSVGINRYFQYKAYADNCQAFVMANTSGLSKPFGFRDFIVQDLSYLVNNLDPKMLQAVDGVTNLASRLHAGGI